jgi:hypothetical protein
MCLSRRRARVHSKEIRNIRTMNRRMTNMKKNKEVNVTISLESSNGFWRAIIKNIGIATTGASAKEALTAMGDIIDNLSDTEEKE